MSKGYVYVLSNGSMPGLVKIGRTVRSVARRSNELFQTGVPTPFKVECEVLTPDCIDLERRVHMELCDFRVADNREFFRMPLSDAIERVGWNKDEQIHELVSEFMPGHSIVHDDDLICPSSASYAAHQCGLSIPDVGLVLEAMEPSDYSAAIERAAASNLKLSEILIAARIGRAN